MSKTKTVHQSKEKGDLEAIIAELKEKYGEGVIMKLGDARRVDVDAIPTGALSLDLALGVGGVPRGRIIEIFGNESSGKTSLALHIVAQTQKSGGTAAFIDVEHALDPNYAKKIGVDINNLLISQPDTGEDALDIVESLVSSKTVDVIVIDSVAALTPRAEIEGTMDNQQIGLQARLMSKALRKITGVAAKAGVIVIFINQVRQKIGIRFGDPETTPGGKALKFYSSVRIKLIRAAKIARGKDIIGNRVIAKVMKNKVAPPFREAEFDILYDQGIARYPDIIKTAERYGALTKKGNTYYFKEESIGAASDKVREWLDAHPKELETIINETKKNYASQLG